MDDTLLQQAADLLSKSKHTTVFTGAGISVESSIPPFRGKNGLWSIYDPKYLDIFYFRSYPEESWNLLKKLFYSYFEKAKPNDAHYAIAELERQSIVKAVVTQNIDHLHQDAGSKNVIEFHGTSRTLICTNCNANYFYSPAILEQLPPKCEKCSEILKPDFVFFSEPIPENAQILSLRETEIADVFLIIGTTGEIQPASSIPILAHRNGAKLVEINIEKSIFTNDIIDIFLQGKATTIMNEMLRYF